jgi:transcriptional regulator with XRE-family HTH domain
MSVDVEAGRLKSEADEPGWEVDPDDDWGVAVVATVGRQLKLRREAVGMRAADFGLTVGYGEDLVYKIETGKRIPRPEYLDRADEVFGAGGLIAAMKEDIKKVRYPKKVRELAQMEAKAVAAVWHHPGSGSPARGVTGPHRATAGRNMICKASAGGASELAWFKSSYSSGPEGDSCVEIAIVPGTVHVRDSKNIGGPQLALTPGTWAGFVTYVSGS